MKKKREIKYYAFLDVVIDVFYSIILYNAFMAFPGFKIESMLMLLSIIVMLNYWWATRNCPESPKYYLSDIYPMTLIMFIFSQWPNYFSDVSNFLLVLIVFLAVDAIYAVISIYSHAEKKDEPWEKSNFLIEMILVVVYFIMWIYLKELNWMTLAIIYIPYIIGWITVIKKKLMMTKFVDNDNQPY